MGKIFKKIPNKRVSLLRAFLSAILLCIVFILIITSRPNLVINNYSLKYFPYIFGLFDITLAWQKPEIDWHSKGFARYEANLSVDQICLDLNKISYCSDKSRIEFFFNFFDLANPLNTLRRINIDGIKLRISSEFKNDREKKKYLLSISMFMKIILIS